MTRAEMIEVGTAALCERDGVSHPDDVEMRRDSAEVVVDALLDARSDGFL